MTDGGWCLVLLWKVMQAWKFRFEKERETMLGEVKKGLLGEGMESMHCLPTHGSFQHTDCSCSIQILQLTKSNHPPSIVSFQIGIR